MFDKIQMILIMKTSISNNRISQLNKDNDREAQENEIKFTQNIFTRRLKQAYKGISIQK